MFYMYFKWRFLRESVQRGLIWYFSHFTNEEKNAEVIEQIRGRVFVFRTFCGSVNWIMGQRAVLWLGLLFNPPCFAGFWAMWWNIFRQKGLWNAQLERVLSQHWRATDLRPANQIPTLKLKLHHWYLLPTAAHSLNPHPHHTASPVPLREPMRMGFSKTQLSYHPRLIFHPTSNSISILSLLST